MVTNAQPVNPERTAWTVLFASCLTFVVLTSTLVFGTSYWLRNSLVGQAITPVYSGTVLVTRPGRTAPEANLQDIPVESIIATAANDQATLTFTSSDQRTTLATVQIFGNSNVQIVQADSPRFTSAPHPHRIVLRVASGRVRVFVGVEVDRPLEIEMRTDPGAVSVLEKSGTNAEVEANFTDSNLTVREGEARITANGKTVTLHKDERAQVIGGAAPDGPLPAERNLVRNGDFGADLGVDWSRQVMQPAIAEESPGEAAIVTIGGRRTVRFIRNGVDWGQVGIVQIIDRDVQGYSSLHLHMDVMVDAQDLRNCGVAGTECPLMAKITFVDAYGTPQEWLQGFFYLFAPDTSLGYSFCVPCSPIRFQHLQWPKGKWQIYESPNLLELFNQTGIPAVAIKAITIYGSGHTFSSFVTDVQLLAQ